MVAPSPGRPVIDTDRQNPSVRCQTTTLVGGQSDRMESQALTASATETTASTEWTAMKAAG